MGVKTKKRFTDSVWFMAPADGGSPERQTRADDRVRSLFHVLDGKARIFMPLFPPLALICAGIVYPFIGLAPTLTWCAAYVVFLIIRGLSQRHDLREYGKITWDHAKASAGTNAAMFGLLIPLAFTSLSFAARMQLTTVLVLAVVYLTVARYNLLPITRIYYALILAPLALAWILRSPKQWAMGAFLVVVVGASEMVARSMRKSLLERAMLELDNEELAAKLAEQVMQLELMNKSRTEQLITACHDLRQPAHAMGLAIEAVLAEAPDGEMREHVKGLQRTNSVLSDMLTSLMDLARLDSGSMQARSTDVPLRTLLQDVNQQFSAVARHKGLLLKIADSDLVVVSDVYLLRRIVFNLVSNAIRYTHEGSVTVSVLRQADDVVLAVHDTGIGIPLEHQSRVFEDYTRIDPSGEGMGIGLSVVRRGCKLLGHGLTMESSKAGTTVAVMCKRSALSWGAPDSLGHDDVRDQVPVHNQHLMVAVLEDDAESLKATMRLIGLWGYRTVGGENLSLLLASIEAAGQNPDVLVTDLHLGKEDGVSAAIHLRSMPGLDALPVLLVTGDLEAQTIARAGNLGFPLMHKPVRAKSLRDALELATGPARHGVKTEVQPEAQA